MKKFILTSSFIVFILNNILSQGSTCAQATQMCGNTPAFAALTSTPGGSVGAANCLNTTPNESWFFMNVSSAGTIGGQITSSGPARDVDGAIWGPYTSVAAACADITDGSIPAPKACDYSGASTVPFNFAASTGFYVMVITNFSNQPTFIDINVTAGNSLICCPPTVNASNTCIGAGNSTFTTTGAAGGSWSVNGGGSITQSGVFTPTNPGCFTATYIDPVSGCSGQKIFTVFPTAPVISAPTNTCNAAFQLPGVPAQNGFTVQYSIDGGTYSATPTIPTTPGCHTITARYVLTSPCGLTTQNTAGSGICGVSNTVSVVVFPPAPTIAPISNTCNSPLTLPSVPTVAGFNVFYSFDGGPFSAATTGPSSVGCHYVRAQYALAANCGNTPAGTLGSGACAFSNTQYAVVFPPAPPAPTVTITGSNLVVTPPPAIAGFDPQYSYDNGATWTTANNGPSADNCTGYQVLTRYAAQGCGSAPSLTPSTIAACASSPVTIRIKDTTAPNITCPANQTGFVGSNCRKIITGISPSVSDNCNVASVTYSITGTTTGTGANDASGTNFNLGLSTVTYTATDGAGNTKTCSFTVTLTDNTPPTINCPPNQTIELSNACTTTMPNYAAQAVTSDNCGAVTVTQSPAAGSTICNNNGGGCGGPNYTVTLTATDASGNTSTCSFSVEVKNNSPLVINCLAAQNLNLNVNCSAVLPDYRNLISATDLCLGTAGITITQSPAPGTIVSGTGVQVVTFTATLGNKTTTCNVNINKIDSTPPSITCPLPVTVITAAGICTAVVPSIPATATDACGLATVTYTLTGATIFTSPTTGINNASGTAFNKGVTTVNYVATDLSGNIANCSFTVTVTDIELPTITCPADISKTNDVGICGAIVTYVAPIGIDNCPNASTIQIAGLASGVTYPVGVTTNTYQVTDASGNTATCSFTVTVTDTELPQITCPANITKTNDTGICGAVVIYIAPIGTDNCSGQATLQISGLASGSTFPVGTTTNIFRVTDAAGNTATCSFTVTITDNEQSTITCPSDVQLYACSTSAITPLVFSTSTINVNANQFATEGGAATDNCSITSYTYIDAIVPSTCGIIVNRTWTVSDLAGNSRTCVQVYTISDNVTPTITGTPASLTVSCAADVPAASISSVTATDNCAGTVTVTVDDVTTPGACANKFTITRTWTATDVCGNSATSSQVITVDDQTAPTITGTPASLTVSCAADVPVASIASVTATDNCAGTVTVTVDDVTTPGACANKFTVTRTWTATDVCGNSSTSSQVITVDDQTAPTITGTPASLTVSCAADVPVASIASVTATDNCAGTVTVTVDDVTTPGACANKFTITRTWTATDVCGNSATSSQVITVDDQTAPTITGTPASLTVSCAADVPVASIASVTATDNCAGTVTVTVDDVTTPGACANKFTVTRTWTATDVCGNSSTSSQVITVDDQTAPTITGTPASLTVSCAADVPVASIASVTATDNCAGTVTVTVDDVTTPGACANKFTITRTWTATDVCGNSATSSQVITVDDQTAPTITGTPASLTVSCAADVPVASIASVTATDNCAGTVTVTVDDVTTPGACANKFTVTRTWTATDVCGNSSTSSQVITVDDQTVPTITGTPASLTVSCAADVPVASIASVTATDNCAGNVTVTVDDVTTPGSCANKFTITRTWTATDVCGNSATSSQLITVDDQTVPTITGTPASLTVSCAADVPAASIASVTATDNCAGNVTVTVADVTTPGSCANKFTITRTWTATDVCGNSATSSQLITVDDQTVPTITGTPASLTVSCAADVPAASIASVTATDNCAGTVTVTVADVTTPGSCANKFTITRTWTATDVCGNSATSSQLITVDDQTVPTITGTPASLTVSCAADVPVASIASVTATDNCAGNVTVTVDDVTTPGACTNKFTVTRTWTATDVCGNSATSSQLITVDDQTVPTITGTPASLTVSCAADVPVASIASVTATDNCAGTVTVTVDDVTTPGACTNKFTVIRTWTATDVCGNSATSSQLITVDDQTVPTITGTPASLTVSCAADVPVASIASVTATDNCAGNVTVTVADVTTPGSCANKFTITRTWTATDVCGNSATSSQLITVDDQTVPTITGTPASLTVSCAADVPVASIASVTATDNCAGNVTVTVDDVTTPGACTNKFTVTRTWTATDVCGNSATSSQLITVDDQTVPTITGTPASLTVSCAADVPVASIASVTATDNCAGNVTVTVDDVTTPGACTNKFTVIRTWTATDVCGNSATSSQLITVDDQTVPTITGTPASLTVSCAADVPAASISSVTATDNCAGNVTVTVDDVTTPGACANKFTITRTWTATDVCGNSSTSSQVITVDDQTAPTITGTPASLTVSCAADVPVASIASVTATDNCAGTVTVTVDDVTTPGACANKFTITRTWTATDVCGNSATSSQVITVDDQTAPTITGTPANLTVSCAADVPVASIASVTATDNCAGNVTVTVDDVTTPGACANKFTITRTWTATDVCGNSATSSQVITVDDQTAPTITGTPASLTVSCAADVPVASIASVTATDNCAGTVTVTVDDVTTPGACANKFTVTRTWTATDVCGNSSTSSQVITVDDQTAPTITGTPASLTVSCAADVPVASIASVTATDNCAGTVTVTVDDVTTPGACANKFTITRTWTATDVCGNSSTSSQVITVDDQTAPTITGTPASLTVSCAADVPVASIASVTATDNCAGNVTVTVDDVTTPGSCANKFTITRTWTATDVCGNSATSSQLITVDDQTVPTITGTPASLTVSCAADVPAASIASVTATDNCAGNVTVTVDDVTTPGSCANKFTITRTWTATDVCGNSATSSQLITVDDQTVPTITGTPASLTVSCAADVPAASIASVTATDNCAGNVTVTVADVTTPGSCANKFTITRTWTATDVCGNSATSSQLITVDDQTVPTITGTPASLTVSCAADVPVASIASVTATDNCAGNVTVTVDDVTTPGACTNKFTVTRTWTATDVCGNSATSSQLITVDDQTVPTITGTPASLTVSCAADVPVASIASVTATDNCAGNVTVTVDDVTTPGACTNKFTVIRTWTATDVCGNSATSSQLITVDDQTVPTITGTPASLTVSCAADVPAASISSVTATDNCAGNVTVTVDDVTTPGACANKFTITRTWTATDVCGNSSTSSQVITVDDQTAPTITGTPASLTVSCAADVPVASIASVTATDNCAGTVTVTVDDVTTPGACANKFTITRTWTATDVCGNSATSSQVITVDDQTAPTITGTPANLTVSCAADVPVASIASVTATDNCAGNVTVTVDDVTTPGACANKFTITRTWTATDVCGNSATSSQVITVDDQTAPTITGTPASLTVSCAADVPVASIASVTATDNCAGTVTVTVDDVTTPGACANKFTVTRTWTATDVCGNSSTSSQVITVDDQTAPTITGTPASLTVSCAADVPVASIASVTATDNCAGTVTVTVDDVTTPGACANKFTITRTWTATDVCGNSSTSSQVITVDDQTAPTITGTPASLTVSCAADVPVASIASVTATDNCAGNVTVTVDDVTTPGSCANKFTITRTWTATDVCGNSATSSQLITVDDQTVPTITGTPASLTVSCAADVPAASIASVTATDNCAGNVTVTVADVTTPGSCANKFTITRTWTATDVCGNSATSSQLITVDDQTVPTITGTPASLTVSCAADVPVASIASVTATDNCAGNVTVTVDDVTTPGACTNKFTVTRTWTATDVCGNSATSSQLITVDDQTVPTITGTPASLTVSCAADVPVASIASVTATDNCAGNVTVTVDDVTTPGACTNKFTVIRTWTATDVCGNSATSSQLITVDDQTVPTITGTPASLTVSCAADVPAASISSVTATDNCAGTVTVTVADVTTPGSCANKFTVTRTWTATDICGNSSTSSQLITVDDQTVPVIICPNSTISVIGSFQGNICSYQINSNPISVNDNCNGKVTFKFTLTGATIAADLATLEGIILKNGTTTISVIATDECNNISIPCIFNYSVSCLPLPVNLISFHGKQIDQTNQLSWKTSDQKGFSHFEIQRSENALEFGTLGNLFGNKEGIYNFIDNNPMVGSNYYKLKMIDLDGNSKFSNVISVNFEKGGNFIAVENPATNGHFNVMTNLKNPRFTLLNSLGQIVEISITETRTNNFLIKTNLIAGVYYLNIVSNGKFYTKKILIL